MSGPDTEPRDCVTTPDCGLWIPPPPPLDLDTPIILPDLATLERFRDALRVVQYPPTQGETARG
jgi:hypothetical protein